MANVQLRNLTKIFGETVAVDSVDLDFDESGFACLLGPSGCGKTTTLRLIAGLEKPTEGEIYFNDERVDKIPANKRDIAMVFQNYAIYPHMSVYENISFPLRMMKFSKPEIEKRVKFAAETLGIAELMKRKPAEISGGQRQRVAVGRAIVRDASVFLMDEPLSNLDAKLRGQMRVELKRLHAELNKTFIYVTHDQAEAMTMANKIAVIEGGHVHQYATPDEIYNRPVNRFVASFIGNPPMNFLHGLIKRSNGYISFECGDQVVNLGANLSESVKDGPIVIGLRPEDLNLLPSTEECGLSGSVYVDEPLGSDLLVVVEVGTGNQVTVRTDPDRRYKAKTKVRIYWQPEKTYFFDPDSGIALR